MKIGFVLTAYNRIDDLLAHIDILKFFPYEYELIPIWMNKNMPTYFMDEMNKHEHAHYVNGVSFRIGPLLALASGLRKAKEIGLDFIVYRNGDDWMFNHGMCLDNFRKMADYDVAAYNWLSVNTRHDFALNETFLRVDKFVKSVDHAEHYFRNSSDKVLCEKKFAKWVRMVLHNNYDRFYRLSDREQWPGVGYETDSLPWLFALTGNEPPESFWELLETNSRFFNERWQLIGSHDYFERHNFYMRIRKNIRYAEDLEKEPHFKRWVDTCGDKSRWNMPELPRNDTTEEEIIKAKYKPINLRKEPKKIPLRFKR